MKCFVTEALIIFFLCFVELFKVASFHRMDIIDNFIGLAEPNNNEIEKRNSIVDGGVFVPYKSTTIVYKSRLVPVTYGFVIKKETLKDNPALYKLGVKLLDEKVESTPKQIQIDEKKVELAKILTENQQKLNEQQLDAKSNCVKGSKVLRLLAKLGKDINKIEKAIRAQNQSVESKQDELIAKSLKKKKESQKLHPQNEAHVSGHKGVFEKELNIINKKPQTQYISKNLSRYWQCRRSHTKKKCAVLLLTKHVHRGRHRDKHPARHETAHHHSHRRKHHKIHERHERKHLNKHNDKSMKYSKKHNSHDNMDKHNNETTKLPVKHVKTQHKIEPISNRKYQDKHNDSTIHPKHKKSHQKHHRKHQAKSDSHYMKHLFGYKSYEGEQLDHNKNDLKRHPIRHRKRGKRVKKKKQQKHRHDLKHGQVERLT